ncbi:hypothetical protein PR048_025385 [Dryococelus australis]|uniref:Uncharacterized protein n=1 Tax=Dryococelus australis TaxID=614101 RepID=A0ABQ9GR37_9NEOP|nr:hypothetical protein PR048_025385 [Dryococelus australis]
MELSAELTVELTEELWSLHSLQSNPHKCRLGALFTKKVPIKAKGQPQHTSEGVGVTISQPQHLFQTFGGGVMISFPARAAETDMKSEGLGRKYAIFSPEAVGKIADAVVTGYTTNPISKGRERRTNKKLPPWNGHIIGKEILLSFVSAFRSMAVKGQYNTRLLTSEGNFPVTKKKIPCQESNPTPVILFLVGATVAERLARSPPNKANRAQSPAGSPGFRKWESCRTIPLVGGYSSGSPVSPAPSFRRLLPPRLVSSRNEHFLSSIMKSYLWVLGRLYLYPLSSPLRLPLLFEVTSLERGLACGLIAPIRVKRGEYDAAPEYKDGGNAHQWHRPARFPHAKIWGPTPPGIEPGTPWWEASKSDSGSNGKESAMVTWSDFGKPWKTEIRMAGPGMRVQRVTTAPPSLACARIHIGGGARPYPSVEINEAFARLRRKAGEEINTSRELRGLVWWGVVEAAYGGSRHCRLDELQPNGIQFNDGYGTLRRSAKISLRSKRTRYSVPRGTVIVQPFAINSVTNCDRLSFTLSVSLVPREKRELY